MVILLHFMKNLDTGMRRLGFLDILISDCAKIENNDSENMWKELLKEAQTKQEQWFRILENNRNMQREVGRLSEGSAPRYIKLATELGMLTEGIFKNITNSGMILRHMRNIPFFLSEGQKIQIMKEVF